MKTKKGIKYDQVKAHVLRGYSITAKQSWLVYGLQRLAPLIHRLRSKGHVINTEIVEENGDRFARYKLEK